jgi:hypothetical protein
MRGPGRLCYAEGAPPSAAVLEVFMILAPGGTVCDSTHLNMHERIGSPNTRTSPSTPTASSNGAVLQLQHRCHSAYYRNLFRSTLRPPVSYTVAVCPPHAPSSEIPYIMYALFQISLGTNCIFDCMFLNEAIETWDGASPLATG